MAELSNPLAERIKKMAAILEAARKAGEKVEAEKAREDRGETAQLARRGQQILS